MSIKIPGTNLEYDLPMWARAAGLAVDKTVGRRSILYRKMPTVAASELFATEMEALRDEVKAELALTSRAIEAWEEATTAQASIDATWAGVPAVLAAARNARASAAIQAQKILLESEKTFAKLEAEKAGVEKVRQLRRSGKFSKALKSAHPIDD